MWFLIQIFWAVRNALWGSNVIRYVGSYFRIKLLGFLGWFEVWFLVCFKTEVKVLKAEVLSLTWPGVLPFFSAVNWVICLFLTPETNELLPAFPSLLFWEDESKLKVSKELPQLMPLLFFLPRAALYDSSCHIKGEKKKMKCLRLQWRRTAPKTSLCFLPQLPPRVGSFLLGKVAALFWWRIAPVDKLYPSVAPQN